ncbi:L10-interacting MYB domain-containing protein-like isoform X1 [Populus nigra]|uniref:L10-interacting MYB domain-containing protein-like isoform X1 n=1 Tax=Populus nigra TaxID=3691 RepID=UPI002B27ABB5|nr:L10-interacting MYB domain-containing protein-like isoform X1 [Populus nigra]
MESTMARHTCLKLEIPEPIFIKGTWFPFHFNLSITDGLNSWFCNATEEEVRGRAAQWDQPVSTYIELAEKHLGFQIPGSVYKFTDAGEGNKRLSWTFEKEGTKLEWRWKCQPSPDTKKTTTLILDFLMDANIRLSMGKSKEGKTSYETENNLAMDVLDRGIETECKAVKAVWSRRSTHIFCDICIQAVQMGLRPGTHFSKHGWRYVIGQFEKESGQSFTKKQLKNKWDGIKKDWKIWKSLLGQENELGWDPNKQTVAASDDWWDEKIKAMPAAEKFRNSGIEPDLCSKYDFMFTGSSAWPTSSAVFIDEEENDGNLMQPNVNIGPAVHVEGSGDLGDEPTFVESLDEMLTAACVDQDSLQIEEQGNDKKQKRVDESGTQSVKKGRNQSGGTVKLSRKLDRLMATVESGGSVTSRRRDAQGCSIIEVMDELHSMPDIVKGSGLHVFASEFFLLRTRREMWFAMREPKAKINWLKTMYDKSVANQ